MLDWAKVVLDQEDGLPSIAITHQVAEVCRPLHAVSKICDNSKEVLFTKDGATVVPEGTLSKLLGGIKASARYSRRGGLYVAKVKVRRRRNQNERPDGSSASPFGRQSNNR